MKIVTLMLCFGSLTLITHSQPLSNFDWIKGDWSGTSQGAMIFESWKQTDANTMEARGFVVAGKDTVVSEVMLIQQVGDQIVFIASINDGDPTLFTFRGKNTDNEYVFENKEHDFPQRIIYIPGDNGILNARIEGTVEGKEVKEAYLFKRK